MLGREPAALGSGCTHFVGGSMQVHLGTAEARVNARAAARQLAYEAARLEFEQQLQEEAEQEAAAQLRRHNRVLVPAAGTSFEPG